MPKNMPKVHPSQEAQNLQCGSCQWFASGFNGSSCKAVREVGVDTPACIEYRPVMKDPYFEMSMDKYIIGIREAFKQPLFRFDATSLADEIKSYIVDEKYVNNSYGTSQDLAAIDSALRAIFIYRSRVSNIYTTLIDLRHESQELISHANLWLYSKYPTIRDLKNEAIRKSAFDRILPESIAVIKNIEKLTAMCKYIDEKLASSEFTLKAILAGTEKTWSHRNALERKATYG